MIGNIVNFFAVIIGSLMGLLFKERFPERIQGIVMQGLALSVILVGLQMALQSKQFLVVVFSLIIGGITGELIDIEAKLEKLGGYIKQKFNSENDLFVQGFVQTSLLYCVGAMAIMGAIQAGLNNDPTILYNKALIDGIASIAFAATFGIGVLFSAFPVLIYQGGITLLALWVQNFLTEQMIVEMSATGGLLILAIGLNMLGVTRIKTGNLLPAVLAAVVIVFFFF